MRHIHQLADHWHTLQSDQDNTTRRSLAYRHKKDELQSAVVAAAAREGDLPRFGLEQRGWQDQ